MEENKAEELYFNDGVDSDSGLRTTLPDFPFFKNYKHNKTTLFNVIQEQRTVKSEMEFELIKFVCKHSCDAHIRCMREVKAGLREMQIQGLFRFHMIDRIGSQHKSYDCICASGCDNATLHYINNDKILEEGVLVLNDLGAKVNGYCSDITCTWPVGGKFTEK